MKIRRLSLGCRKYRDWILAVSPIVIHRYSANKVRFILTKSAREALIRGFSQFGDFS
jgi:hypothetical protein